MNFKKTTICLFKKKWGIVFLFLLFLFFNVNFAYSATVEELQSQIDKITETKKQLELEIAEYEKQLKNIGAQAVSLKNTIKSLNATINKNALDIKLTQSNIDATQLQIEQLADDIDKNIDKINKDIRAISLLINQISKYDDTSLIENLLTYKNLSEFWNEQQNIFLIQNQIREKILETKNTKTILENNKTSAEKKKVDLLKLKASLTDRKKLLDISKKEKNKLLADTKNSEATYKKMLAEKQALADSFDQELLQFESELKFAIDASSIPAGNHGILSWPLSSIFITSPFGPRWGKLHNGVDFRASMGTPVKASLGGVVKGTGDTDTICRGASFGKWVFVEHENGLSTIYAHLSLIKVSVGQAVTTGDVIGYSGNTGASTGPHLHESVYATQGVKVMSYRSKVCNTTYMMPVADTKAYLDPMLYLPSLK
jgi:murein DD-endopeptidase MepM/ murein hydrolase activator NlpD